MGDEPNWEKVKPLGEGGQSNVFLARTPQRTRERQKFLELLNSFPPPITAVTEERAQLNVQFAGALLAYTQSDLVSELGALKIFKIRQEGGSSQALERLRKEVHVLRKNRMGLPRLLDASESEGWIVTEYFPRGTVEDNITRYKGNVALALKAFLSLVNVVTMLHDDDVIHRDIKPANVFVRELDDLVLGDFGIVFLPDQPNRATRTGESVGPHDYMPPWTDVGGRLENVDSSFDVYMLGKLLWCMVTGRLLLKREWFREPVNDISIIFEDNPHAYMINRILEKCVVDRRENCISIHELRSMVSTFMRVIEQGGQLLQEDVPRPCHVCGGGRYEPQLSRQSNPVFHLRLWNLTGNDNDIEGVRLFSCNYCGHITFFRASSR